MNNTLLNPPNEYVQRALLKKSRHAGLYAVYRVIEMAGTVTLSNPELAAQLDVSASHVRKCMKVLEKVGLLVAEYAADGDKRSRRLTVAEVTAPIRHRLKSIAAGAITIDLGTASVWSPNGRLMGGGPNCVAPSVHLRQTKPTPPSIKGLLSDSKSLIATVAARASQKIACKSLSWAKGSSAGGASGLGDKGVTGSGNELCLNSDQGQYEGRPGSAVALRTVNRSSELFIAPVPTTKAPLVSGTEYFDDNIESTNRVRSFVWSRLSPGRQAAITDVLDTWTKLFGYPLGEHTPKRRMFVNHRLKHLTVDQLKTMLTCAVAHPDYGHPPRSDISWLCRHPERVEQILVSNPREPLRQARIMAVLKGWQDAMQFKVARSASPPRQEIVSARLDEGLTVEALINIAVHVATIPFYRGQNDRAKAYDDVFTIYRSRERCERFLEEIAGGTKSTKVDRIQAHLAYNPGAVIKTVRF